jgi:hypothetical protein
LGGVGGGRGLFFFILYFLKKLVMERKERIVVLPFGEAFQEKWELWKDFKVEQFAFRYKTIGEQGALKALVDISQGREEIAMKIIDQSIANGWKGLFELKTNNGSAYGQQHHKTTGPTVDGVQSAHARRYGNQEQQGDFLKAV